MHSTLRSTCALLHTTLGCTVTPHFKLSRCSLFYTLINCQECRHSSFQGAQILPLIHPQHPMGVRTHPTTGCTVMPISTPSLLIGIRDTPITQVSKYFHSCTLNAHCVYQHTQQWGAHLYPFLHPHHLLESQFHPVQRYQNIPSHPPQHPLGVLLHPIRGCKPRLIFTPTIFIGVTVTPYSMVSKHPHSCTLNILLVYYYTPLQGTYIFPFWHPRNFWKIKNTPHSRVSKCSHLYTLKILLVH